MIRSAGSRRPRRSSSWSCANPLRARSPIFIPWSARAIASGTPYLLLTDQSVSATGTRLALDVEPCASAQRRNRKHAARAPGVDPQGLRERAAAIRALATGHPEDHLAHQRYPVPAQREPDPIGGAAAAHAERDPRPPLCDVTRSARPLEGRRHTRRRRRVADEHEPAQRADVRAAVRPDRDRRVVVVEAEPRAGAELEHGLTRSEVERREVPRIAPVAG